MGENTRIQADQHCLTNTSMLRLLEATPADLDRIMHLERQGFAAGHQEQSSAYAQRMATFPKGSLMAWLGDDCVGCIFTEIWQRQAQPDAGHFALGHDIRDRHDTVRGTELYIHGRDGRIRERSSYGADPHPPKG